MMREDRGSRTEADTGRFDRTCADDEPRWDTPTWGEAQADEANTTSRTTAEVTAGLQAMVADDATGLAAALLALEAHS